MNKGLTIIIIIAIGLILVSSINNSPKAIISGCSGGWYITGYFTPIHSDYLGNYITINAEGEELLLRSDFLNTIQTEGWGKISDGKYIGWYGNSWHLSDNALDSNGNTLNLLSVAVDTSVVEHNTLLTVPSLPSPYGERKYLAIDIGPSIIGKHIDIFTGEGKQAEKETFLITGDNTVCIGEITSPELPEPQPTSPTEQITIQEQVEIPSPPSITPNWQGIIDFFQSIIDGIKSLFS